MGESVILPSMTDQMVLGVFKYLVEAELRKSVLSHTDFRFGCQEGMIAALVIMFGQTDDSVAEKAYDNGVSWSHIINDITEGLQTWVDTLENISNYTEINFEDLQDAVDKAVNNYALKHPRKLGDALRINL